VASALAAPLLVWFARSNGSVVVGRSPVDRAHRSSRCRQSGWGRIGLSRPADPVWLVSAPPRKPSPAGREHPLGFSPNGVSVSCPLWPLLATSGHYRQWWRLAARVRLSIAHDNATRHRVLGLQTLATRRYPFAQLATRVYQVPGANTGWGLGVRATPGGRWYTLRGQRAHHVSRAAGGETSASSAGPFLRNETIRPKGVLRDISPALAGSFEGS
jgi:hypothetical protein